MTESPRRPLTNEWSKTGYRSYTSPSDRLSKRLGASLPNLEQPVSDIMTAAISHRTASLRKMSPDVGQCCSSDLEVTTKSFFLKFNLSLSRVEVSSETHKGFPPPRLPSSIILSLRPELLLWYGCIPGKSYWFHPTWGVCTAGQVLHRQGTGCKLPLKHLNDQTLLLSVCVRYHYLRGLVNTVSNRRVDALEDFQSLYKTDSDIFPLQMVKSLVDSLTEAERLQVGCETQSFLDAFSAKSRN